MSSTHIYIQPHKTNPSSRTRRYAVKALTVTGLWWLLPGRVQGALCNCAIDRHETAPASRGDDNH